MADIGIKPWQLKQRQSLDLDTKIKLTKIRIRQWYEYWNGNVYVAFSGGVDSTVLLNLVRNMYPDVPAVFCDTGLEYPEIKNFINTIDNVTWLKPELNFRQTIEKYGYPIISKQVAVGVDRYRNTKLESMKDIYMFGGLSPYTGKLQKAHIPEKYWYLVDAPFKISGHCCDIMKKNPSHKYGKLSGRKPFIGTMAVDSNLRRMAYYSHGCNAFNITYPSSTPISFWLRSDIKKYIELNNLPYSKIYDIGETHTGCMFCMFGVHMEKEPNRFQRMESSHPKLYSYCIYELGLNKVLDFIGVNYEERYHIKDLRNG